MYVTRAYTNTLRNLKIRRTKIGVNFATHGLANAAIKQIK
jgi:hypothetical protein